MPIPAVSFCGVYPVTIRGKEHVPFQMKRMAVEAAVEALNFESQQLDQTALAHTIQGVNQHPMAQPLYLGEQAYLLLNDNNGTDARLKWDWDCVKLPLVGILFKLSGLKGKSPKDQIVSQQGHAVLDVRFDPYQADPDDPLLRAGLLLKDSESTSTAIKYRRAVVTGIDVKDKDQRRPVYTINASPELIKAVPKGEWGRPPYLLDLQYQPVSPYFRAQLRTETLPD